MPTATATSRCSSPTSWPSSSCITGRPLSGRRDAERVVLRVRPAGRQAGRGQIKTIGDAVIAASGLPDPRPDHVTAVLALALDTQAAAGAAHGLLGQPVRLRLGVNTGPVVAGVIGAWSPRHSPATSKSPRPGATKPATITGSPPASWSRWKEKGTTPLSRRIVSAESRDPHQAPLLMFRGVVLRPARRAAPRRCAALTHRGCCVPKAVLIPRQVDHTRPLCRGPALPRRAAPRATRRSLRHERELPRN